MKMDKVGKIFIHVGIIISIIILLACIFFLKSAEGIFLQYYSQQLDNYSSVFKKTIAMAGDYTKMYDQSVADDLFYRLSVMEQEFQDISIDVIDREMLQNYKDNYDLFGMAIFSHDSEGVFIYNSTISEEIGERTKDWGYWNTAFESLFEGKNPSIGEGHVYDRYWIGPRSKSYYEPDFYRYAYFYNEQQDYLINAIIRDDDTYGVNIRNLLDEFFEHLYKEVSYIEAVSLIDLAAWEKAYHNDFKNRESPAFLYGDFDKNILISSGLTPEDLYNIDQNENFKFKYKGKEKTIFMVSAGDEEHRSIIAILLNDKETDAFIKQALLRFVILMIFTMAVILSGIFYIVARYRALLTFQIERNQEIERFTKNVSMIPEITYKCKIQNDELMLTYNYGKSILEDQKISLESTYRPMKKIYSDEYVKTFGEQVEEVFRGASKRFEITYKDGHYEHFVSPIFDKDGTVIEIIGIANNITDRRIAEEQSKYLATHDFLTDLWNRRTFEDEVKKRIYSTYDESYAIMIIDLDNFKRVNDSYGHIAGDLMLKYAANCIRNAVKKESASSSSVIARMGGDEFAVFLPYANLQEVDDTAKHIVDAIFEPHMVRGRSIQIGASVGIALYSKDSRHYKQLTYYADVAMYRAKKSKIGGYRFFKRSMLLHE